MIGKLLAVACAASTIVGCASVPRGDAADDAALKQFAVRPEVAGVYVYCDEWMGTVNSTDVEIDGMPFGQNTSFTYQHAEVAAGRHIVTVKAENEDSLEFEAEAGRNYYVLQEVKLGWLTPRVKLRMMEEAEGRKGVRATRLAAPTYRVEGQSKARSSQAATALLGVLLMIITLGAIPPGMP